MIYLVILLDVAADLAAAHPLPAHPSPALSHYARPMNEQ